MPELPYRLIVAITAEEEISGARGVRSILDQLDPIDLGIVGEPTEMQMAIAEKGLVVLDCKAKGKSGHAARDEGLNALYVALDDIEFVRNYQFERVSPLLGPVKMTVTQMNSGHQHNVVPALAEYTIDIRTNEYYNNLQVIDFLKENLKSEVKQRSSWLNSSYINPEHPIVKKGQEMGLSTFGSSTLSDQALMDFPTIKIGPGVSARSHTADEFIKLREIKDGIDTYINLLSDLKI
jgi:acetylornithine deacetylase